MKTIKLMKLWFMALALLPLSINAQNSTRLSVEDFTISGGETKTMTVDLDNPDMQVTLVQFDLVLPEGLSVQGGEDGIEKRVLLATSTASRVTATPGEVDLNDLNPDMAAFQYQYVNGYIAH